MWVIKNQPSLNYCKDSCSEEQWSHHPGFRIFQSLKEHIISKDPQCVFYQKIRMADDMEVAGRWVNKVAWVTGSLCFSEQWCTLWLQRSCFSVPAPLGVTRIPSWERGPRIDETRFPRHRVALLWVRPQRWKYQLLPHFQWRFRWFRNKNMLWRS